MIIIIIIVIIIIQLIFYLGLNTFIISWNTNNGFAIFKSSSAYCYFLHIYRERKIGMCTYSLREKYRYSEFFWSVFSRIRTEYEEMLHISPYSVGMRENAHQKNSENGHFSRIDLFTIRIDILKYSGILD